MHQYFSGVEISQHLAAQFLYIKKYNYAICIHAISVQLFDSLVGTPLTNTGATIFNIKYQ